MKSPDFPISALCSALGTLLLSNCATSSDVSGRVGPPVLAPPKVVAIEHGEASWYSVKSNGGTQTASGECLHDHAPTAAHKTLPLGTKVRVTNLANGLSEVVTITDRGPYIRGRSIDLTIGCAERLDFVSRGVTQVKVEVLEEEIAADEAGDPNGA